MRIMAVTATLHARRASFVCLLVIMTYIKLFTINGPTALGHRKSGSDALKQSPVAAIIPEWNCVNVESRTIIYSQYAPGVKTALRENVWKTTVAIDCTKPDVIVFTPGQLASEQKLAELVRFIKKSPSTARDIFMAVDCSNEYGVSYSRGIKQQLSIFASAVGVSDTRHVIVGAGALGHPCRREFNGYWLMKFKEDAFDTPVGGPAQTERFLCLGGNPRSHKVFMMSLLHSRGALDKFAWSGGTPSADRIPGIFSAAGKHGANIDDIKEYLKRLPHVLDIDAGHEKQQWGVFHASIYSKGAMHIVLETDYLATRLRYTEKTIKSIYAAKPFVILASPGVLELLKSHGFRTFHPHINETYDAIGSFDERIKAIADEVDRLLAMPGDEFSRIKMAVTQVAHYNRKWLGSKEFRGRVAQQALFAFGIDNKPGFDWQALESTLRQRGGPDTPHNC
jgi:hypothetical protein